MVNKIVIVAMYFGRKLPEYFNFWLNSCARNRSIHWVLFTDCNLHLNKIPENIKIINTSFDNVFYLMTGVCAKETDVKPYKLCDLKPLRWVLLDQYHIDYDYWGYCDIDMIFGDLKQFINDDTLRGVDRMFSLGHLSIIKNNKFLKIIFLSDEPIIKWENVKNSVKNLGFDEHSGVEKIWHKKFLTYKVCSKYVADVLPLFKGLILSNVLQNIPGQYFKVEKGKVYRCFSMFGYIFKKEYAYIHLQKRKIAQCTEDFSCCDFYINSNEFSCELKKNYLRISEIIPFLKTCTRPIRKKMYGVLSRVNK